jgi:hypothetical protein
MSARGVLSNPALFVEERMPVSVLSDYLRLAEEYGGRFSLHSHHLQWMMDGKVTKAEKIEFGQLRSLIGVREWMEERGWLSEQGNEDNAPVDSDAR